jgi:hypothetical protein
LMKGASSWCREAQAYQINSYHGFSGPCSVCWAEWISVSAWQRHSRAKAQLYLVCHTFDDISRKNWHHV